MLLWLALICSWGPGDGCVAQKFSNVRFGGVRRLGLMTRFGAFETVRILAELGQLRLVWSGAGMVGKPPRKGEHPSE
jgi:hypothetical protein